MRRCKNGALRLRLLSLANGAGRRRRRRLQFSTFTIADIPEVKEAEMCAKRGDWGGALQLLERATMVLSSVPEMKLQTMSRTADIYQKQGNISKEISVRQSLMEIAAAEPGCQQYVPGAVRAASIALLRGGEVDKAIMYNIEALQDLKDHLARLESEIVAAVILTHHPRRNNEVLGIIDGVVEECQMERPARGGGRGDNDNDDQELQVAHCVGEMVRVRYYHHHSRDIDDHGTNNQGVSSSTVTAAAAAGPALAEAYSLLEGSKDINGGVPATTTLFGGGFSLEELAGVCLAARGSCYGALEEGSIELEEDCLNKAITRFETIDESKEKGLFYLANTLRSLANLRMRKGDGVVAEGLLGGGQQSSHNGLSVLSKLNQLPKSILVADLRVAALRDYAVLLEKMEWNGRSRKPEADKLSLEANMIEKEIFKEGEETNMEQVGLLRNIISFGSITDQWLLNVFGRMPF